MNPKLLNGSVLTYIGDSYYEHEIRSYLVGEGLTKLNDLHQEAIKYTSGKAQAKIIKYLLEDNLLTEEEINIYKREMCIRDSCQQDTWAMVEVLNGLRKKVGLL